MSDSGWCLVALIIFFIGMYLFKLVGDGKIKFCPDSLDTDEKE